jgi:transglutaminase-like putative cysteine protease
LSGLSMTERSALLVDAFLVSPDVAQRRRLLACTTPEKPEAAALGLAALWDPDPSIESFARVVLQRQGARVVRLLGNEPRLTMDPEPLASSSPQLAPAGLLQVLVALPKAERLRLGQRLFNSGDPKLRAAAIAALRWQPALLSLEEQAKLLREGSSEDASLLAAVLPERLDDDERLTAARARLDRLRPDSPADEKQWALSIVARVAARLDTKDTDRLQSLGKLLDANAPIRTVGSFITPPDLYPIHLLGLSPGLALSDKRSRLPSIAARWRAWDGGDHARDRALNLERIELGDLPLPPGWSYFRIEHPRAFVAGFADLGKRLATTGDPRVGTAQVILHQIAASNGGADLDEAGLDGDRPLECMVSTEGDRPVFVCSGRVTDPVHLRERLGALANPRSVGVALPWFLGSFAHMLPSAAAFASFAIAQGGSAAAGLLPPAVPSPLSAESLISERVDDIVEIAGAKLARRTTALVKKSGASFDESLALVDKDRFWLYSDERTAVQWRSLPKVKSASSESARALLGPNLGERPGLRGLVSAQDVDGGTPAPIVLEVDLNSEGVHVRHQARAKVGPASLIDLLPALPAGDASHFVGPALSGPPFWNFQSVRPKGADEHSPGPPEWLWRAAGAAACAWYPGEATADVTHWLSAVPWNQEAQVTWKAKGLAAPTDQPMRGKDLWYRRRGTVLLIGPDRALIEAEARGPSTTPAGARSAVHSFEARLDARAFQRALDNAAEKPGIEAGRRDALKFWGNVAALASGVDTFGTLGSDRVVIDTTVRLPVAQVAAAPALIDEWLRSKELRNSWSLPRPLTPDETKRPLRLTLRSSSLPDLRRAFPTTPRASVTQKGNAYVLSILPQAPRATEAAPPPPRPATDAAISATARELTQGQSPATLRAETIGAWVHDQMVYELTPGQYDDLTLLTRKRGDCTEYAQLTIALLHAAGIPARPRTGFLASGATLVAHAWLEFHDGTTWREMDPTAGRPQTDASYIDASVLDVLGLLGTGQLEVTAVE